MNYKNFETSENKSFVELHKTDYNNYADLSHFVDEYYKAQALIKECNNFYRSFLKSKLLPYSKIVKSIYTQDKYRFFEYKLSECNTGQVRFTDEYPQIKHDKWSGCTCKISIKGLAYLATAGASFKLMEELANDPNSKYYLKAVTNSYDGFRTIPDYLVLKTCSSVSVDLYGGLRIYRDRYESVSEFEDRKAATYKLLGLNENELHTQMEKIRTNLEKKWQEYYKDEMIRLFEKYDVCLQAKINNKLKQDACHCFYEYKKRHNNSEIEKYQKYFDNIVYPEYININVKNFIDKNTLNSILITYAFSDGFGHWGCGPVGDIIKNIDSEKVDKYICDSLAEEAAIYREILIKYENENENQKLYIIDNENKAQYFCDTDTLPSVDIELKDRELVCTYTTENRYQKYSWPSDSPWTVEVTTTTVIFNVSDNSIKSYSRDTFTHEENYKRYKY